MFSLTEGYVSETGMVLAAGDATSLLVGAAYERCPRPTLVTGMFPANM